VLGGFALAALVVAVLAGRRRLWITATVHGLLVAALAVGALAAHASDVRDRERLRPHSLPSGHLPCHSGSGNCVGG
jgi:hypothetical protein